MKKTITLFICLLTVFSMTACGSKSASESTTTKDSKNKTDVTINTDASDIQDNDTKKSSSTANSSSSEIISNNESNSATAKPDNTTDSVSSNKPVPAPSPVPVPAPQPKPTTVIVTIPEGYTLSQIGDKLAAAGVCTKADFLNAANSYNFNYYSLVAQIPSTTNRVFKLEGYLFPNTYQFNLNKPAQDAVGVLIRGVQEKITNQYSYSGMTLDEIITLASIIQMESPNKAEMANISSVLHNRLNKGLRLQADSTIFYIERYVKPIITGNINRYNSYYNTYKCTGLPAGPICNPGTDALNAAIHPAQTEYLYFVSDKTGKTYYAKTYEEQQANCTLAGVIPGQANTPSVQ